MNFHANYVSTSVFGDGDYYQATFEAEQDTDDPDSPYLLIQRQFEDPDDNRCYIEMHDEKYCGHFLLRRVGFTPQKLSIELDRQRDNLVSVTFAIAATEFAEASQVVKILAARSSLPERNAYVRIGSKSAVAPTAAHSRFTSNCGRTVALPNPSLRAIALNSCTIVR
jgi:hypothetical protein